MFESILTGHIGEARTVASSSTFREFYTVLISGEKSGRLASQFGLIRHPGHIGVPVLAGELDLRWNQILSSLLNTYEKLKKLGFTYENGSVSIKTLKFNWKGKVYE